MRVPARLRLAVLIGCVLAPAKAQEDWQTSPPKAERVSPDGLAQLDEHIRENLPHVRSLLIARHGLLVFEKYYADASRDSLQNVQSMTKSVTSALVGIALKKHLITSLDTRVLDHFPEYSDAIVDARMKNVTVRHLLTMASGIAEVKLAFDRELSNPVKEILSQHLLYAPGEGFTYSSAAAHLLGAALRKAAGRSVLEFAEQELFRPLGIHRVVWYADKTGLQSGGMSALFRARDFLKLGELYLRRGAWHESELIPRSYVADSITQHNEGDFYGERARYGYMWWITKVAGYDAFYARGYGGQYLMIIPRADLVVLCTSDWKQPEYPEHFALMERFLLPAISAP